MNELGTRRYTELVDRLNGLCGLAHRYLSIKIEKEEKVIAIDNRVLLLKQKDELLAENRIFVGIFNSEREAKSHIESYEKINNVIAPINWSYSIIKLGDL